MKQADSLTIAAGVPGATLMEAAGKAVADYIKAHYAGFPVLILCGPGNNGGDGFIAAHSLKEDGVDVTLACLVDPETLKGDAAWAARIWAGEVKSFENLEITANTVIVDAVFGTGFDRPLEPLVTDIFEQIKRAGCPVIAVDIPSGVNGNTGAADAAVLQAQASITFFRKKLGHVLYPGAGLCGKISVQDIGIQQAVLEQTGFAAFENNPELWREKLPHVGAAAHKYNKGHAVMLGGAEMTGAIRLASEAAMRAGAGLCSIAAPPGAGEIYRKGAAHILIEDIQDYDDFTKCCNDERRTAILIGPGAGLKDKEGLKKAVLQALELQKSCVLDADALSVFEGDEGTLLKSLHLGCVLTPHEGEFRRVFSFLTGSKLEWVEKAAEKAGCTVLLKGPDTVIAAPGRKSVINSLSVPALATAGSGDVLAGVITGYMTQGVPGFEAACIGAWVHTRAGLRHGPGLVATDLPDLIPEALREVLQ